MNLAIAVNEGRPANLEPDTIVCPKWWLDEGSLSLEVRVGEGLVVGDSSCAIFAAIAVRPNNAAGLPFSVGPCYSASTPSGHRRWGQTMLRY